MAKEPPTLSGFKKLKSLSVLDIDSLDIVTEIKSCVRSSSGTLAKLKLSFSETLAAQARKPPPDADPEDSDPDDEFQVVPSQPNPGHGFHEEVNGPAKAYRAQEERKSQETVLGRIFDVEPYLVRKPKKRPGDKDKDPKDGTSPGQDFIAAIRAVSDKLMKDLNGAGDFSQQQMETLEIIEAAARKYVAEEETKSTDGKPEDAPAGGKAAETLNGQAGPSAGSSSSAGGKAAWGGAESVGSVEQQPAGEDLFAPKTPGAKDVAKKAEEDVRPEDINIEEPEDQLVIETPESVDTNDDRPGDLTPSDSSAEEKAPSSSRSQTPRRAGGKAVPPGLGKAMANMATQKDNFKVLASKLQSFEAQADQLNTEILQLRHTGDGTVSMQRIRDAEKKMSGFTRQILDIQGEMHAVQAEILDTERQIPAAAGGTRGAGEGDANRRRISEYVRSTRGLALKTLSIYLIPTKPSVLSKAVDLRVLKSITLLNVGPQAPIWALLTRENKTEALPLRKIFTDNVSLPFLNFVSALEELHELYMLERDAKYKPESFASKTTTTTEQIRRLALRKHLPTLRRLMIKNLNSNDWDMDEKTTSLLTRAGGLLEELAVSMNIKAIVSRPRPRERGVRCPTANQRVLAHAHAANFRPQQPASPAHHPAPERRHVRVGDAGDQAVPAGQHLALSGAQAGVAVHRRRHVRGARGLAQPAAQEAQGEAGRGQGQGEGDGGADGERGVPGAVDGGVGRRRRQRRRPGRRRQGHAGHLVALLRRLGGQDLQEGGHVGPSVRGGHAFWRTSEAGRVERVQNNTPGWQA